MIEHGNVVPPLQKQTDKAERTQNKPSKKGKDKDKDSVDKKAAENKASKQKSQARAQSDDAQQPETKKSSTKKAKAKTSNAVEQLTHSSASDSNISTNNELPIPAKRRRRQPSVVPLADIESKASDATDIDADNKAQDVETAPKAKAEPKAKSATKPKTAKSKESSNAKESKVSSQLSVSKVAANSEPVPSKRRRRQPSTDMSVTD